MSSFDLTLISNVCTKSTYSLDFLVSSNKWNSYNSCVLLIPCVFVPYDFFHYVLQFILYSAGTVKLPFLMGVVFFCLSFDIYSSLFYYSIIICIVKQMYINFSVLFSPHL